VTLLWLSALSATLALPTSEKTSGSENDLMASIYADCLKKESISCIKYKVFTFVDKMLADKEDITLSEGITVVKSSNAEEGAPRLVVARALRAIRPPVSAERLLLIFVFLPDPSSPAIWIRYCSIGLEDSSGRTRLKWTSRAATFWALSNP
jgi:hypothetical protein